MAEAIFNSLTDSNNYKAYSCGLYGDGSSAISNNAKLVLEEIGIQSSHISTPISETLIKDADIVIGMTSGHAHSIISAFPSYADKIYTMPIDISDPFGGNIDIYRHCRNEIAESVRKIINSLAGEEND